MHCAMAAARILIVGKREGDASLVELEALPANAEIVAHGETLEEILAAGESVLASVNVRAHDAIAMENATTCLLIAGCCIR